MNLSGFMAFTYWFYLLPACLTAVLGLIAVYKGKVPKEIRFYPREMLYPSILIESIIPLYNILTIFVYGFMLLR